MISLCRDNMLSKEDCEILIKFFKKKPKKNFHKHETEDNTYNIVLELNTEKYFFKHFDKLIKDLNYIAKLLNNSMFEYTHLVKWPLKCYQPLHRDFAYEHTTLSSILYLNDDYDGGET